MRERQGGLHARIARLAAGAAGAVLAMTVGAPVWAQDEESGGEKLCDFHDPRLQSPEGIAAADDGGWWIVTGGENQDATLSIQYVGTDCNPQEGREVWIDHTPLDPQALSLDDGGFIWVGDTGGATERDWITLNQIDPEDPSNNVPFRYVFPGSPQEIQAFLILPGDERTPLFVSATDGEATLYSPAGDNQTENTPMDDVGTVTLPEGGTVTGAALNADASKVVLRTEVAAYEYDVEGGEVIRALTDGTPVVTPLADEGQSQDVTYDADGNFLTLTSVDSDDPFGSLYSHTPAAPAADEGEGDEEDASSGGDSSASDDGIVDWLLGLGFTNIIRILTAIAVVGFIVMLAGIMVIRKHRRAGRETADDDQEMRAAEESVFGDIKSDPPPPDPVDLGLDAGQPDPEVGQIAQGTGSVYGAARPEPSGNVYGSPKPSPGGGSVYGAAKEEPPQYGGFEAAGQGSVYGDAGQSFAVEPPPAAGATYGAEPRPVAPSTTYGAEPRQAAAGTAYGVPQERTGSVYGAPREDAGGTVYGAGNSERTPEPEDGYWGPPDVSGRGR